MMRRRLPIPVLALVLLAGACSSGDGTATGGGPSSPTPPDESLTLAGLRTSALYLQDRHGAEEAFAIVVVALDRGYAVDTIIDNVQDLDYTDWSTPVLPDVSPDGPLQGVIERPDGDGDQESGLGPPGAAAGDVELAAIGGQFSSAEARDLRVAGLGMMLGELFRQSQEAYDGREPSTDTPTDEAPTRQPGSGRADADDGQLTDRAVLEAVLVLSARGYSLEQIVLALATGDLGKEGLASDCWYLPGEAPEGGADDQLAGECTPLDEIPEPGERASDDEEDGSDERASAPSGGDGAVPRDGGDGGASVDQFCRRWDSIMASTGGDLGSLSIHELAEMWATLTEAAPSEIRPDMVRVLAIWNRGAATNTATSLYDSTGPDASAVANVEIYVDEVCGIDLGGE